ncbi:MULTISPECIES: NAD(P)/FAD-dependent oxidoreductase [unclassified Paenibacillus]|uniref:NAD(P)/FAD-dependent oxidoreductase n=1 Tax=unclassified Paenibacillus TaxID=185978 RepID=UPI002406FB65|nr:MULTISPECIES: NAD(P)/FAD-dependent oxidoreductase [unclassified Paenibacillus]MDF9842749.1 NADH dehydrogenase [Paenibacillus sp. PastF-2]MDF9849383.1 NADH dehydrogenase [Paenibacillus sp. PastM-2]MDF9855909.1 NADH dehydrogenase [Paenibacillus sp. PastF-1]MDH6481224.1 NADH dehydrogenase [Paenibacillus sp. PastH-2]MDH6508644.1 NADH dehydrogenase [Paenibacillus sp. PastM-3]
MRTLLVLGGGYGGLALIQELLGHHLPHDVEIVLIDRMPYQGIKTEYYALAAGTVNDYHLRVQFPVHPRLTVRYGEVSSIDLDNRLVFLESGEPLPYDILAIALGCTDNYHGIPGAEEYTCSIQSFSATRETYRRLNDIKPYGTVSIVGGGLSGVEIAAELRESRPDLNISILDRGERVLSAFPAKLSRYVEEWFSEHQVKTLGQISVSHVEKDAVFNGTQAIAADVTVWTAGIQPVKVVQQLELPKDRSGRLIVGPYSNLADYPEVYVIGDCASLPFAPSAQAAGAQGEQVADVLRSLWRGDTPRLQAIKLKGTLGSLGKNAGFGLMGRRSVMGRVPRLLKSGVLWMSKRHFG